jgi:hypothetical protein
VGKRRKRKKGISRRRKSMERDTSMRACDANEEDDELFTENSTDGKKGNITEYTTHSQKVKE